MKPYKILASLLLSLPFLTAAKALTFSDVDVDGNEGEPDYLYMSSSGTSSWNKTFNLLSAGFDPSSMRIVSAVVSFAFADDHNDRSDNKRWKKEYVTLSVGGETPWSWLEVDGSHSNSPYSYDWYSTSLSAASLDDLQDGVIAYSVEAEYNDFYLKEASLVAEVEMIKVPDAGATLGMLGLGIATVFILRRQMLKGRARS
ncbi:VPDSG-CTERM sorting domain-containing protein [Pelagicoccus sp. SDUM812005]|uniref:VPDSG-CTERM sorting domain-containing protein n=1 Tax=Pelagicoccus sp. SDUM812005 TaxID=3041257 RepID=UPI00280EA455|nr:VPDSG-CTERM sorting domain-containing protein [Pelagicoccus sp. SDUM812005]MDQ8183330.1 VPDSG-CTERM sorting domain-containing protein [Pelagicoccus sp. SDUM812005]